MTWTLSEFLDLLEVRGRSWCLIELRGSAGFSVPANNNVIFHTMLEGHARIAGISGGTIDLAPGDARAILSGERHVVRTLPESAAPILDFLRSDDHDIDSPEPISIGNGPVSARLLSARLKTAWPGDLRRTAIPPMVGLEAVGNPEVSAMRIQTLQSCSIGAGATILLTRMAQMTLTLGLRNHPACPVLFQSTSERDPITHAMQLIGADPCAPWSVSSLAQKVGMGRSNFAARFAGQIGRTPMDVITEQRMRHAAALLEQSDLKIADIGERAGYNSEAAFSRRFTRFFGISPGRMRHKAQAPLATAAE